MTNKTVAERLREDFSETEDCEALATFAGRKCKSFNRCRECHENFATVLADMIEAEQADLRNQSVDLDALDLLCGKLDCGDENHRSIAAQIRKAMKSAKPSETRALPEGIFWPRFEDGELVKFGDEFQLYDGDISPVFKVAFNAIAGDCTIYDSNGAFIITNNEPVKRPEPEVLDADGVPIKVGDTTYDNYYGFCRGKAKSVHRAGELIPLFNATRRPERPFVVHDEKTGGGGWDFADNLTHRKPDTLEDVVSEMLAQWDENGEEYLDMDGFFARFRKLMGGE